MELRLNGHSEISAREAMWRYLLESHRPKGLSPLAFYQHEAIGQSERGG